MNTRSRRTPRRAAQSLPTRLLAVLTCALLSGLGGCIVHEHTVGLGPNGLGEESARQFYWMFGLFRLNEVDTERMTDDFGSYRIRTERSFSDLLLTPLLLPLTITTRTVTVTR